MPRFEHLHPANAATGRPASTDVFEIEVRGDTVESVTFKARKAPHYARVKYFSGAQAEGAYQLQLAAKKRGRWTPVGPSRLLDPEARGAGSTLLLDELYRAGDPRFLDEVLGCAADEKLATLAAGWAVDTRPEMRRALLEYVDDGCDRRGHRALVKRLFKTAEEKADDELMAHFMVAFDRLSRRFLIEDWTGTRLASNPVHPERTTAGRDAHFSRATRRYLARRVFRWFRRVGKTDPARYARAMTIALPLYRDAHLDDPARLLDAWSLLHTLYGWSPVLLRDPRGIRVKDGRSLADLAPAPYLPAAFRGRRDELFGLLAVARSRTVRAWTIAWLEAEYELDGLDAGAVLPLLASAHDEVVAFGGRLFGRARGIELLSVDAWIALLRIEEPGVAARIAAAFEEHVSPRRVTLAQCVELASARVAAVAEMGLRWAKEHPRDLAVAIRLVRAPSPRVREEATRWILELLGASAEPRYLRDLFDASFADVRAAAIAHVEGRPAAASVALWLALVESPYDDVRGFVVKNSERWQADAGPEELEHLASTVVLAVRRGAAAKPGMVRRIAERAIARPAEAERLLPILALALRSVRPPERASALAALTQAAIAHDALRGLVARYLPELSIGTQVSG